MNITSQQIPEAYRDIRPYAPDELPSVIDILLHDPQFCAVVAKIFPSLSLTDLETKLKQCKTNLDVQKQFIYPFVDQIVKNCSKGAQLKMDASISKQTPHTFVTNHRDIVLDSAILSYLLIQNDFDTTVEIAIGDNLLIYPWIKHLVRINKSFIVQRSLPMREFLRASELMSKYMHFAVNTKKENIWIAQREGRSKDSCDQTQSSILKMMAIGGEGTMIERLRDLNIVPLTISYEYDPCDFLKAQEFQQKRDDENFKKAPSDDLLSMKTGIYGQKGQVHYESAPCINDWLDTLNKELPKAELFNLVAQHIDEELHRHYRLYPINFVALDMLCGNNAHANHYSPEEKASCQNYFQQRVDMVQLEQPDKAFLLERLLTMYANPLRNYEKAVAK